jgi:hypothetical protein
MHNYIICAAQFDSLMVVILLRYEYVTDFKRFLFFMMIPLYKMK